MPQRILVLALAVSCVAAATAQQQPAGTPRTDGAQRLTDRMRALQEESEQLARQSQTLVGELRKLEIDRELRRREADQAEATAADARAAVERATARLTALEQQRQAELPDLEQQLVEVYKRGRGMYARLLFGANSLRDFARATRVVSALSSINERRVETHRRTLASLAGEKAALEKTAADLQGREAEARRARAAAERAVAAHAGLIAQIDSRRDLAAQYVGELQVAYDQLQQVTAAGAGEGVAVPLAPFRGGLDWPVSGRVAGRFGQTAGRLGGTAVRNGIEISAAEDTPVLAVHGGTVGYAEPFTGFGNLVIVEHGGGNYSLYGYLGAISVTRGERIAAGAELGRVGLSPAGPPALYFEMRIDGRAVDPLQWLKRVS